METNKEKVDLSRYPRRDRRRIAKLNGIQKIVGRNLPFVKAVHGTIENYYKLRKEEEQRDQEMFKKQNGN